MESVNLAKTCKGYEKCPIYNGILKGMTYTAAAYREQYCDAGPAGWNKCRRYQVKSITGKCPENLLPNSMKTAEEIIGQYSL
jgi:hypothetical protein